MAERSGAASAEAAASVFQSDLPVEAKLERARVELLDLSSRNRLLNIPRSSRSARIVEVVDENSAEVFRLLVREGRTFTFAPGRAAEGQSAEEKSPDADDIVELAQPEDDSVDERGVPTRHSDTKLQTRLTSKGLQKRLLDLYFDARTLEEEQGVNILFLALGTLRWIDPTNPGNVRHAPLILVPVRLERGTAGERFKLRCRQEDLAPNLSLEAFLDRVHTLRFPLFEPGDAFDPTAYHASVTDCIASKPGWAVLPDDIVLGFFSFAKFLMYRDLDPAVWPDNSRLTGQPLIRGLVSTGFDEPVATIPDNASIDPHVSPADMLHIVDSDSSQTLAVHDVRRGSNLVIQGPPGTGKSQTIANIIASAVADGKTVLFVAEKMAALEVVKRRLDQTGVGDACLELHSNKANKRLLLDELRRTWELGSPKGDFGTTLVARLQAARDALNEHAARMHRKHPNGEVTPYQVIGELARLRKEGRRPADVRLESPASWSPDYRELRAHLLAELASRIGEIGRPADHPWSGVELETILPTDLERLMARITELASRLTDMTARQGELAALLDQPAPATLKEFGAIAELASRIAGAPDLSGSAMMAGEWTSHRQELSDVIAAGFDHARLSADLAGHVLPSGWGREVGGARSVLARLSDDLEPEAFERMARLHRLLPGLVAEADRLSESLGLHDSADTIAGVERAIRIGERVGAAPQASPEAFAATVWENDTERVGDLVEAVATLEQSRREIGNRLADAAWTMDFTAARQTLAMHGTGLLRSLSGEWRAANRLVRSVLNAPDITLPALLSLLDSLARGRAALSEVRGGDGLGSAAFGADWRGDRSASAPLRELWDWMRSLRELGPAPRLAASRLPNRVEIAARTSRVRRSLDEVRPLLEAFWSDLRSHAAGLFDGESNLERVRIPSLTAEISAQVSAEAACRDVLAQVPPRLSDRLAVLDKLAAAQQAAGRVADAADLARNAFDAAWRGTDSDWQKLASAAAWIDANGDLRPIAARLQDRRKPAEGAIALMRESIAFIAEAENLLANLQADGARVFGAAKVVDCPIAQIASRFALWIGNSEQLSKWVAYRERSRRGRSLGIGGIVDGLENGDLEPADALPTFEMAYYEAMLADQIRMDPALARFDGQLHGRLVQEFAELDVQRIAAARLEVVQAHHRRIPQSSGGIGPLGVLRAEMARRRGHMPIRQLMQKAAPAIQALKPVLMMSPLSVAQFLPPGQLSFDLLVMDEASQIQPVDALGAIARCRQVVVVGDERQLPPTRFFAKLTGVSEDDDDEDGAQVADIESVLGLFTARGMPQRMLLWHYRSRHQSLIAVSNSQFYENRLFIVPSPYTLEAGMGLRFHHIPNGVYDSGNTRTNAVEAKVVAEAILRHAKTSPEQSLGVATFSVSQRRAIQDQVELLRRLNPDTEAFFHSHPSEPFFVKNLENVQGDERDVILISVGYGRNAQGQMAMRFGPLGAEGGERRLNVLISRAKRRCEVFASITDEDIDPERTKGKGVLAFKLFLHFARTGRLSLEASGAPDADSVFEGQVAEALQARGYQVHARVGIAGFFIDLAIADPERPGRYLLGIECDGPSYRKARSARDRDRLRKAVLEDHGWITHRIWSIDWFQRPREQLERAVAAIEAARAELDARLERGESRARAVPVEVVTIERAEVTEVGLSEAAPSVAETNAYVEATLAAPAHSYELHETPTGILADLVEKVVAVEGPVHVDEVVARLRTAWGLQRAGARIQAAVERGVAASVSAGRVRQQGRFLSMPDAEVRVRDRSGVFSTALRKPEMLPPAEVRAAILQAVRASLGAGDDEIIQAVSRAFGFKATSVQLREVIEDEVQGLCKEEALVPRGDMLILNDAPAAGGRETDGPT